MGKNRLRKFRRGQRTSSHGSNPHNVPSIPYAPQKPESTRTKHLVFSDGNGEETPVKNPKPVEVPASTRYIVSPVPEQKGAFEEYEVVGEDAKVEIPEGSWGYCIHAVDVYEREGRLVPKKRKKPRVTVYKGREYTVKEVDLRLASLKPEYEELKTKVERLEAMQRGFQNNKLERLVELPNGQVIGIRDSNIRVEKQ